MTEERIIRSYYRLSGLYTLAASQLELATVVHETHAVTRGLFSLAQQLTDT